MPAIKDPNHDDLVLWESGAILEYIVETYDKEGKLTLASHADKWHLKQYLHFQMSGQVSMLPVDSLPPGADSILQGSVLWPGNLVQEVPPGRCAQREEAL